MVVQQIYCEKSIELLRWKSFMWFSWIGSIICCRTNTHTHTQTVLSQILQSHFYFVPFGWLCWWSKYNRKHIFHAPLYELLLLLLWLCLLCFHFYESISGMNEHMTTSKWMVNCWASLFCRIEWTSDKCIKITLQRKKKRKKTTEMKMESSRKHESVFVTASNFVTVYYFFRINPLLFHRMSTIYIPHTRLLVSFLLLNR